jgi:hypothetical protein
MLKECKPRTNDLCYLPRYNSDFIDGSKCAEALYKGGATSTLNKHCAYKCQSGNAPLITQINSEIFVLTNAPINTYIKCNNKITKISNQNIKQPGAIEIHLPCECMLFMNNKLKIGANYPCEKKNVFEPGAVHILPSLWSKLETLNLRMSNTDITPTFQNFTECLNLDWQKSVPHFYIKSTKHNAKPQQSLIYEDHHVYIPYIIIIIWNLLLTASLILIFVYNKHSFKFLPNNSKIKNVKYTKQVMDDLAIEANNITINFDPANLHSQDNEIAE